MNKKFEVEDDEAEEERLIKEQEDLEAKTAVRRLLRSRILELAPQIKDMPPEALTCAEYAVNYVRNNDVNAAIPFPGYGSCLTAMKVVEILGLQPLFEKVEKK